jgi:hypothetical protein
MTYLEAFFFDWRLREAQTAENLSGADAQTIRQRIRSNARGSNLEEIIPSLRPVGILFRSAYADVFANYLTVQREWEEFNRQSPSGSAVAKEALLQDHARRFFEGRVSYSPP